MNYQETTRIYATIEPRFGWDNIRFWIHRQKFVDGNVQSSEAGIMEFKPMLSHAAEIPCAFSLRLEQAQELMECLWSYGIRPKDTGTVGQLAQAEKHLIDLRAIVFHVLKIPPIK